MSNLEQQAPSRACTRAACHRSSKATQDKNEQQQQQEVGTDAVLESAFDHLRKVSADGLPSWEAKISWYDDPCQAGWLRICNEVDSIIKVAVVPAELL